MNIALIADIHGNLAALEAVLDVLAQEQPDQIVCLGDVAATGPQPRDVIDRLRALGCRVVMGNADAELLDPPAVESEADEDTRKILDISRWGASQLDEANRAFIASFRPTIKIPLPSGGVLLCCHGSPRSYDDYITATTPDDTLESMLTDHDAVAIAYGHTHIRLLRFFQGREIVNPGSVGRVYQFFPNGRVRVPPWAEFAILSCSCNGTVSVDFRQIPYDRDATVRAMTEQGMPHATWWAADWKE